MDTTSVPPQPLMPASSPGSETRYRLMDSNTEALAAIESVVALAQHELCIFDVSPQALRTRDFARPQRIDALKEMLLKNRNNRIRIALHETAGIEAELARLVALKGLFSLQMTIHRTIASARDAHDVMLIADQAHFWRKPYFEHPRSVLTLSDPEATQPFMDRFEQIWESSELASVGGATGL